MEMTELSREPNVKSMKTRYFGFAMAIGATAAIAGFQPLTIQADGTNAIRERIGVYDSRVVAYAYFCSEPHMQGLNAKIQAAKDAQVAGNPEAAKMAEEMKNYQQHIHLQVFSSAPVPEALAAITKKLPEIERNVGVSCLISKWDETALNDHPNAEQVDLTDQLAGEFKPGEKQLKVIESIKKSKPVPSRR